MVGEVSRREVGVSKDLTGVEAEELQGVSLAGEAFTRGRTELDEAWWAEGLVP